MIRISKLTDYAVVLLTQIVRRGNALSTTQGLAAETGLPQPTVSKIMKILAKSDLLTAQRGAAGGYSLARGAGSITMADIIEAMDGPVHVTDCAEKKAHDCQVETTCPVNRKWDRLNRAIKSALASVSLQEMANDAPGVNRFMDAAE